MQKGYYHLQLEAFLLIHHPDKLLFLSKQELDQYIDRRAEEAGEAFEQSRRAGHDVTIADEEAHGVLFSGLEFSPYDLLKETIEQDYPAYLPLLEEEGDQHFKRKLLAHFLPIISRLYDPQGNAKSTQAGYELTGELGQYFRKMFI